MRKEQFYKFRVSAVSLLVCLVTFLLTTAQAKAQWSITGNASPNEDQTITYTISGSPSSTISWDVGAAGIILSSNQNSCQVHWLTAGASYVKAEETGLGIGFYTHNITVSGSPNTVLQALNLARSYQVKKPNLTTYNEVISETSTANVVMQSAYFDGLGRSKQTIIKQITPDSKDFVSTVIYNELGQVVQQYLPYEAATTNGKFKITFTDRTTFYTNQYGGDTHPYSTTTYEKSPLNRAVESIGPGQAWNVSGSEKSISITYRFNRLTEGVFKWNGTTKTGTYPANQLMVAETTDEDGRQVREYKNERGQVILKRVQKVSSPADDHPNWLNTYYVYDDLQRLNYVFSPKAVALVPGGGSSYTFSSSALYELCFVYAYDNRGRMIIKRVPGTGDFSRMVYDNQNRLVLAQDANQRAKSEWVFTRYDALSRPIMTGVYKSAETRNTLQAAMDAATDHDVFAAGEGSDIIADQIIVEHHRDGVESYEAKSYIEFIGRMEIDSSVDGIVSAQLNTSSTATDDYLLGYYDNATPSLDEDDRIESVTYYDNYLFTDKVFIGTYNGAISSGTYLETPAVVTDASGKETAQGQITGSRTRIFGTDDWLETVMFYDKKGRVIQTQGDNHTGGVDIVTNTYDFSGKILHSYTHHKNPAAHDFTELRVLKKFTYDHADRLTKAESRNVNQESVYTVIAENSYDAISQLAEKKLGNALQTIDYKYNIRGWMTDINDATTLGADYFAMKLDYNTAGEYNGNIGAISWASAGDTDKKRYDFSYDELNRLTQATYINQSDVAFNNDFNMDASYDENGNILTLNRRGRVLNAPQQIDALNYTYAANSNQLISVGDTGGDNHIGDFGDGNTIGDDYSYDANGNMIQDANKDITSIGYNRLNLPSEINFKDGHSIAYLYDAAGIKLRKTVTEVSADTYSAFYNSDFSAGTHGWSPYRATAQGNINFAGETDVIKATANTSNDLHRIQNSFGDTPTTKLRVKAKVYIPSANPNVDGILVQTGFSAAERSAVFNTKDQWFEVEYVTGTVPNSSFVFLHMTKAGTVSFTGSFSDLVYVKDLEISTVKEAEESEPKVKITDYISGFIYEGNNLQQFGHEEGRVRKNDQGSLVYDFVISDHLGNARTTFTTEAMPVAIYKATMETELDAQGNNIRDYEDNFFYNLNSTAAAPSAANVSTLTDDNCTDCNEVAVVNGETSAIGPAIILDVMPGDEIDLEVWAYATGTVPNNTPLNTGLITALTNAFVPQGVASELGVQTSNVLNAESAAVLASGSINTTVVNAYLNYVVFDQTYDAIVSGHQKIGGTVNASQLVSLNNINITQKGSIYIWVSNDSDYNLNVYFDDLKVTHQKGQILQEDHYYPFGMNINALSSSAALSKPNKFKYNGFEEQTEFDLGWYDYQARYYDPQLGRFMQIDPAADLMRRHSPYNYAFDNPIRFIDPDGMMPTEGDQNKPEVTRTFNEDGTVTVQEKTATYGDPITTYRTDDDGNTFELTTNTVTINTSTSVINKDGEILSSVDETIDTHFAKETKYNAEGGLEGFWYDIIDSSTEIDNIAYASSTALDTQWGIIDQTFDMYKDGIENASKKEREKLAMMILEGVSRIDVPTQVPEEMDLGGAGLGQAVSFLEGLQKMTNADKKRIAVRKMQMRLDSIKRGEADCQRTGGGC